MAADGFRLTNGSTDMAPTPGPSEAKDPEDDSSRDPLERARRLVALELDLAETRRRLAEDALKITEAQLELAERELEELRAENEHLRREIEELRSG
jgi:hypothetical protein